MRTSICKNGKLSCFIKFSNHEEYKQALGHSGLIEINNQCLVIRKAFTHHHYKIDEEANIRVTIRNDVNFEVPENINKCCCRKCNKLRVKFTDKKLVEIVEMIYIIKRTKSPELTEELSLKMRRIKARYVNLLMFFHHNVDESAEDCLRQ